MSEQQINRISGKVVVVLSLIALLAVLSGYFQPPQPDEGSAAHIFQLSIAGLLPAILVFLATTDWRTPLQSTRRLAFPAATLAVAFEGPLLPRALPIIRHICHGGTEKVVEKQSSECACSQVEVSEGLQSVLGDSVAFFTPARATFRMPA